MLVTVSISMNFHQWPGQRCPKELSHNPKTKIKCYYCHLT